eukprot:scaffold196468_cov46-Prasinocladus_malaysianus.AAC.1
MTVLLAEEDVLSVRSILASSRCRWKDSLAMCAGMTEHRSLLYASLCTSTSSRMTCNKRLP